MEFSTLVDKLKFKLKDSAELAHRFANFKKAKDDIAEYQRTHKSAQFELNKFALMSEDEKKSVSFFSQSLHAFYVNHSISVSRIISLS